MNQTNLTRIARLLVLCFLLTTVTGQASEPTSRNERPNVILVLIDDQGYGDISLHGNPVIETPNIDRLGRESVRFTDFHTDPTCSATRAALLTGKYARRVGVWHTIAGGNYLSKDEVTMADAFKASGYRTGLFGKWHLGGFYPYRPIDRGFEEWFGQGDGGTGTTDDWFFNDRVNDHYLHNGKWVQRDGWATDVLFDAAIDFLRDESDDRPFFLYLATFLPHEPPTVPDPDLIRAMEQRLMDAGFPPQQKWVTPFLASIEQMDKKMGDLLDALDASGKEQNTIFIFMTDNGTAFGETVYNADMRGRKTGVYEGGHRVPFFVRWPGGDLAHGKTVGHLTSHFDVFPTLVELAGLKGAENIEFDGTSLAGLFRDPDTEFPERILFVERQRVADLAKWSNAAALYGKWRLVNNSELYDLEIDPGQKRNLIERYPEIRQKLRHAFDEYWEQVTSNVPEPPYAVIGSPNAPEVFLHAADWQIEPMNVPWNHAMVAAGPSVNAPWRVYVEEPAAYRFELRRWPREADVAFAGVPNWDNKTVDAWDDLGGMNELLYRGEQVALPVQEVSLVIGGFSKSQEISEHQSFVQFEVDLPKGFKEVHTAMLDGHGKEIAGAYYVYITRLD